MTRTTWLVCVSAFLFALGGAARGDLLSYEIGEGSAVDANRGSGLLINTWVYESVEDIAFDLDDGDSFTFDFFKIWTPEHFVERDDLRPQSITAYLDFDVPDETAIVTGETFGQLKGSWWFEGGVGRLTWDGPTTVTTSRGEFTVELSDATFEMAGWRLWRPGTGMTYGSSWGANITATITQGTVSPVPAPGAAVLALVGLGLLGRLRRRGGF